MALLRQCLLELRSKHHERDGPAVSGPESRTLPQPALREPSVLGHAGRNQVPRASASQRQPRA